MTHGVIFVSMMRIKPETTIIDDDMSNELDFVTWLRDFQVSHRRVGLGIGDDMAVITQEAGLSLISSDMLLDGVHFDTSIHSPGEIGRKAVACCLSDCAAMAVHPIAATVSLALPHQCELSWIKKLFSGMLKMATSFELAIVGGDTTTWNGKLAIDICIWAEPWLGIDPVTRNGAQIGDNLYVTGKLGGSLLGRHMTFTPRVVEARIIAETLGVNLHAMIDISDGLSLDCWRLCQASSVGCVLEEPWLEQVIHSAAKQASIADGQSSLTHMLQDGEDFELLLAACADHVEELSLMKIGTIAKQSQGMSIKRQSDGSIHTLPPKGFVH